MGKEVCPKIVKTSLIDVSLARSIGKSYDFASLGIVPEVFGPGSFQAGLLDAIGGAIIGERAWVTFS